MEADDLPRSPIVPEEKPPPARVEVRIYALFDAKTQCYMDPFVSPADGAAMRTVLRAALDPNHVFHHHGHDFSVFRLGVFDQVTGKIEAEAAPTNLGTVGMVLSAHQAEVIAATGDLN